MNNIESVMTYGVSKKTAILDETGFAVEEIRRQGYSVLPKVLSLSDVTQYRQKLDAVYDEQVRVIGHDVLEAISDTDNVRCPLLYDQAFLSLALLEPVKKILNQILGPQFVLLMQNGIINRSDRPQYQARWHRDLNYQHWTSSHPIALNFLICVDDFTAEGGATWVLPGSHLVEDFPSDSYVKKHEVCAEAPAGSIILVDAMTYHRAGINSKKGFVRRAVNHVVGLPFLAQQISIPDAYLKKNLTFPDSEDVRTYLGFRWNPPEDDIKWREAKYQTYLMREQKNGL